MSRAIYDALLDALPGSIEAIVAYASFERRQSGLAAAIAIFRQQIESDKCDIYAKGALTAEWARLLWKVKGSVEEARQVFKENSEWYKDSRYFWVNWLNFEMEQPTQEGEKEGENYERIKEVVKLIREKSCLPPLTIKDLCHVYMVYLMERGGKDAAKEFLWLDKEVNGSVTTPQLSQRKVADNFEQSVLGPIDSEIPSC